MKRLFAIVAAWCVCAFPASRVAAASSKPLHVVVLGDSLAFGTGATDPADGLTFRIYRELDRLRPGSDVTDYAIGGSRAGDVDRLQVGLLDPRATDLVLVIVGGNDVVRRTPASAFARDYGRLLRDIRTRVSKATIVAFGVPDVARSPLFTDSHAMMEALSRTDDEAMRRAAATGGIAFVDLFAFTHRGATPLGFFSSDDFHPSDAGYATLAAFSIPTVIRALR